MICTWTNNAGLMDFENIDKFHGYHVYSLAWRFTDNYDDPWTFRLNMFKNMNPKAINAACFVMPLAVSNINWCKGKYVIIPAIPSGAVNLSKESG